MAAVVELRQLMDSNLESSASIAGDVSSVGSLVLRVLQAVSSLVNPPKPKSANNVSCQTGQGLACAACLLVSKAPNIMQAVKQQCPRLAANLTGTSYIMFALTARPFVSFFPDINSASSTNDATCCRCYQAQGLTPGPRMRG